MEGAGDVANERTVEERLGDLERKLGNVLNTAFANPNKLEDPATHELIETVAQSTAPPSWMRR